MLYKFKDITDTLQRGISLGLKTKVLHEDTETGRITELSSNCPEGLFRTFCPDTTIRRVKPHGEAIVVTSATTDAYLEILNWMSACATQKKVLPFAKFPNFIFYRATRVAAAANILGIREREDAMEAHLYSIARHQVHTDDVFRIYTDLNCAAYKNMVVQSIARAIFEKRLKAPASVKSLRHDMPHVDDDIEYEVEYLKAYDGAT